MSFQSSPIGIIDIGSNSIRFVVFESPYIKTRPAFNEKIQCGLGKDLGKTNTLNEEGKACTLKACRGFKSLADAMSLETFYVIGTAALRMAEDGPAFRAELEDIFEKTIDVLDGDREAYLAASGVLSSFPQGEGIVGDLGGGSLELACIQDGLVADTVSLPLGVLVIRNQGNKVKYIEEGLKHIPDKFKNRRDFYVVGGTWRAVAGAHMKARGMGDERLNGYYIPADQYLDFARLLSQQSPEALISEYQVESRRAALLPSATLLLSALVRELQIRSLIVSNAGLRDGVLMDILEKQKAGNQGLHL